MFQTNRITLIGDRRGGERFPQIRGAFLLIDKCDIPCEISLDGSFYFIAREGLDIRGPFNELYIRHPNYIAGFGYSNTSDARPSINIVTSTDSAINNYYSDSYFPGGIPFQISANVITAPIFGNIRYIKASFDLWSSLNVFPPDFRTLVPSNPSMTCEFFSSIDQLHLNISTGGFDIPDDDSTGGFPNFSHSGGNGNKFIIVGKWRINAGLIDGTTIVRMLFNSFDIPVQSNAKFVRLTVDTFELSSMVIEAFNDGRSIGTILAK